MSDEANTVHDLNGSETTKEETPSNSLLNMRKGLFGNSASLLNTFCDNEQIPEENAEATACEGISESNEASLAHNELLDKVIENQNGDKEDENCEEPTRTNEGEGSSGDQATGTTESANDNDHSGDVEPIEDNEVTKPSEDNEPTEASKNNNFAENHEQDSEAAEPIIEMPSEKDKSPESVKIDDSEAPASVEALRIEIAEDDEEVCVQKTISMDTSNIEEPTSTTADQEVATVTSVLVEEENDIDKCEEDRKEKKCNDEELNVKEQNEVVEPVTEMSPKYEEPVDEPMVEDNIEEAEGAPNEETEVNSTRDEQNVMEERNVEMVESLDTPADEEEGPENVQEKTEMEENAAHEEETEIVEQTPRRGRRSLTQATTTMQKKTPARSRGSGNSASEENAVEESPPPRRSTREKKETEKDKEKDDVKKTSARGREKKDSEPMELEEKDEKDVTDSKTPARTTRIKKDSDEAVDKEEKSSTKKTPRRRGKKDSEPLEMEENEEEVEMEEVQIKKTPRGRGKKDSEQKEKNEEDEESQDVTETSARRSRRSATANLKEMPTESTSTPARRSTRTPAQNKTPATSSKPKNTPASASRVRPKRAAKEEKAESEEEEEHEEEAEVEEEEARTPARGRKGRLVTKVTPVKSAVKTPVKTAKTVKTPTKTSKSVKNTQDEDPYDIDDMIDNHPEPFKNIQMDVQSFGAVTFSKVGTGKYERTEKAAQERVVNLADLVPSENKPEKRKSLMDLNKKELELPVGSKSVPPKRSKRGELVESDIVSTPKRDKKTVITTPQTLKTPSSVGRKRKEGAVSTPRPKKLKIEVPELDDSAQLAADLPEDGPPGVVPGSRVFALYDKVYYPASVINRDGLGRFQVYFIEDAMVKELPEASVIPIASLQTGKLASFNEGDNTIRGRIVTMPAHNNWSKGHFILEPEDEEAEKKQFSKSWDALLLDMDDWKDYIKEKSSHATDVKMDNIESTEDRAKRRTRATPTSSPLLETKTPSRTPARNARRSIKNEEKEEKMETEDIEEQNDSGLDNNEEVTKKTPQKTPKRGQSRFTPKSAPKSTKKESRSRSQNTSAETTKPAEEEPKHESDEEMESQDPEPLPKNIDLFKDKVFILTSANRQPAEGQLPFRKNEMKLRILERGGVVVDDMVAVPLDAEAYLISDMHYRTHKYLAAMSRAMPCVSHEWIHECVKHEKLLDYHPYVLKGGVSILDDQVYDLPDVRDTLLKGLQVCVYSTNDPGKKTLSFCQIWDPIVSTLGATVVSVEEALSKGCDVTVTDSTCAPSVAAEITKKGGHVVSSEWLIQSIIMGARQAYDAHPRFQHDGSQ